MRARVVSATAGVALLGAFLLPFVATPSATAVDTVPNPVIVDSCALDLTLVLDASGSVQGFGAVDDVREAARGFLDALSGTGATARLTQFGSFSAELAPRTPVDDAALAAGGALEQGLAGYYSPRPSKPTDADVYLYSGTDPADPASYTRDVAGSEQFTNWDAGLEQAIDPGAQLVVFVTDGEPTAFDLDHPGDPFDAGPPPDVAVSTGSADVTLARAVEAANRVKTTSRVVAVGVGSGATAPSTQHRLAAISGPTVVVDPIPGSGSSINDVDVAIVSSFDNLAAYLSDLVFGLCAPGLAVQTLADGPAGADYRPVGGNQVTVTPAVPSGFGWVLPDSLPGPSKTSVTDEGGRAVFQWRPAGAALSQVRVSVPVESAFVPGRPSASDYSCSIRDSAGGERTIDGEIDDGQVLRVDLADIGRELATCTVYSTYNPRPQISLAVSTPPGGSRGDLDPPVEVTSTLTVTNPGNVPLSGVTVNDDDCERITPDPLVTGNQGDVAPANGLLDPSEEWRFSCQRTVRADTAPAGGQTIDATTTVVGTDPSGTVVQASTSSAVVAFLPEISVTASLTDATPPVQAGSEVAFVYTVANTGNSPLTGLGIQGTPADCVSPTVVGADDGMLLPGESLDYRCVTTVDSEVTSRVNVAADPVDPLTMSAFPPPNPPVLATDSITVEVLPAPPSPRQPVPAAPAPAAPAPAAPAPAAPVPAAPAPAAPILDAAVPVPADQEPVASVQTGPAAEAEPRVTPQSADAPAPPDVTLQLLGTPRAPVVEARVTGAAERGSQLVYTAPQGYILTAIPAGCDMVGRTVTCALDGDGDLVYRFTLSATGEPVAGNHEVRLVGPDGSELSSSTVPPMTMSPPVAEGAVVPIELLPILAAALVAGMGIASQSTGRGGATRT